MLGNRFLNGQIGYRFIPKTACTSIKRYFFQQEYQIPFEERKIRRNLHVHEFFKIIETSIDDCNVRVIVIRDPIRRFLSAYGNRVVGHDQLSRATLTELHGETDPPLIESIPQFNPDLPTFIEHFDIYSKVGDIYHHCHPITDFLDGNSLQYFTHVFTMESLESFPSYFNQLYGKNLDLPWLQTSGTKHSVAELGPEHIDFLLSYYQEDYELVKDYYTPDRLLG